MPRRRRRWLLRDPLICLDQVGNAPDSSVDLTPVSDSYAQHVRDGTEPWLPGQSVPLLWEHVYPDQLEDECRTP